MVDQGREIINSVLAKMSDKLTPDQLTLLEANLIVSMHGMKVEKESTELAVQVRDWEWYLSRFRATKRLKNCSESTIRQYDYTLSKLREYVPKMPQQMTGDDVKYFLAMFGDRETTTSKKPVSKSYINNMKNNLSSFFAWMHDEGYIGKNPVKSVPKIKVPKTVKHAYSGSDMEKMKSQAATKKTSKRDLALLYFLDSTGCRVSEAISVDIKDINWDKRSVVMTETKKARKVPYLSLIRVISCLGLVILHTYYIYRLQEYLKTRTDDNPALFVRKKAPYTRLSKTGAEYIIRTIGKCVGVHAYPHRFRRTMITRCNKRGMPIQTIQTLAGHVNATTPQINIDMGKGSVKA